VSIDTIKNLRNALDAARATGQLAEDSHASFIFHVPETEYTALEWPEELGEEEIRYKEISFDQVSIIVGLSSSVATG
jgi:hypothetical protein